ncbi:cytochrome c-type biogenesis protein CcmH [Advenella sp. WQ 585]|uniref:Cytochrome c-type biogenesis protein n=1 Tax=Advenella mandrilli TaxID=2800330 RepID=A0ABS1EBH6_9BURK|nr:cytochrome c-type biogenesis protein [Advenella mandrilli]MBK1780939.1 cytochrome c-type biogenesis protein CcmH [Advenella mandrilli]
MRNFFIHFFRPLQGLALALLGATLLLAGQGLFFSGTGWAQIETRLSVAEEERLREIAKELRCLVCQNESIADSQAGLAQDLRKEIRGQITIHKTDEQIIDYLVLRYGEFVHYRPVFSPKTYLLWLGPFALLVFLLFSLWRHIRRQAQQATATVLDEQDIAKDIQRWEKDFGNKK